MPYTSDRIGHRRTDTSFAAAQKIAGKAPSLRTQALILLKETPAGLTADEIAERLGRAFISIRPRLTELKDQGLVFDSGERREGNFGTAMIVWRHVLYAKEEAQP